MTGRTIVKQLTGAASYMKIEKSKCNIGIKYNLSIWKISLTSVDLFNYTSRWNRTQRKDIFVGIVGG